MAEKRLRIFAGPNGSGKSTILKVIQDEKKIDLGVYVNADEIESALKSNSVLDFSQFKLEVEESELRLFFQKSEFSPKKRNEPNLYSKINVANNLLSTNIKIDSYFAADLAEFIRQRLMNKGTSFTFETVLSHPSKLEFLKRAKESGFRIYLYYVATDDPKINISRVALRVLQNGHNVSTENIINRYHKSLSYLKQALMLSNRAYLFDNSQRKAIFIAEGLEGKTIHLNYTDSNNLPNWFISHVLEDLD